MEDDQDNHLTSKKRAKKQRTVLAAEALGFEKPELPVIDLSPRRVKKKPVVGNSEVEQFQRLFNFRSKFRLVVDADEVSEQQAKHFDGTCINEWLLVQQVVFTASENLPIQCPICHNDKYEICAPKITPCGHVFCWTCILRFLKLSSGSKCPVCMKFFNLEEIRSCRLYHYPAVAKGEEVSMVLRIKQPHNRILYDPITRQEDHNFSRLMRVEKEYLWEMLIEQQRQLETYRKEAQLEWQQSDKGRKNSGSMGPDVYSDSVELATQALEASIRRLSRIEHELGQRKQKPKSEQIRDKVHFLVLPLHCEQQQYLYQEQKGRQVFIHPILNKYLMEEYELDSDLPLTIKSKILFMEPVKQDLKTVHRNNRDRIKLYREATNLIQTNDEGMFAQVELPIGLLSKPIAREFLREIKQYKSEIEERERLQNDRHQQLVNKRLAAQQERQKKLMLAEPWPVDNDEIKDLKNCNRQLNFPSLGPITTTSQIEERELQEPETLKHIRSEPQPSNEQALLQIITEQFPELTQLKKAPKDKNQLEPGPGGKKKKKKQQVDITSMMFQRAEEDWD